MAHLRPYSVPSIFAASKFEVVLRRNVSTPNFLKPKQIIFLLEGWDRYKTVTKCKQMLFLSQTFLLIFGGLNITNK